MTLSASRARLREVLDAISTQARIPIVVADTVANDPVSVAFRAVPLDEGLKRLLAAYDVFYLHSASDKSAGSIKAIWVYARGDGWELEPVPPTPGGTKELEAQLQDGDPGERSEAYEALIERQGDRGLATALDGLSDFDESVRLAALSAAVGAGIEIPASDLEVLVRHDPSRAVRLTALRALEARPEAKAIAASVKDDPDELVRNHARQILQGPQTRQILQDPQAQRQRRLPR